MSLIYVTGIPGVGKSTIQRELQRLGYEAYDIDQPRFGGPTNLITGEPVQLPPIDMRSKEWFDQHEWRVSRDAVQSLKNESINKTIYLCGTTTTEHLIWDLFDKVLYLHADEETLKHRLANRKDNDFGKSKDEMEIILARFHEAEDALKHLDATIIDARGTLQETVAHITKYAENNIK